MAKAQVKVGPFPFGVHGSGESASDVENVEKMLEAGYYMIEMNNIMHDPRELTKIRTVGPRSIAKGTGAVQLDVQGLAAALASRGVHLALETTNGVNPLSTA